MATTLDRLRRTSDDGFRARIVELGGGPPPGLETEPLVTVQLEMPLSDARRFGQRLYEWVELVVPEPPPEPETEQDRLNDILGRSVDELELSVRSSNCMNNNIRYIGDLVQRTEAEMLEIKNFGRKSLREVKEILAVVGLRFDMKLEGWARPREDAP